MLKLDFSLPTSKERNSLVTAYLSTVKRPPTQKELDTLSNYILFGKDADGTSSVDRGEIEIETKYNTYRLRKTVSLEELSESTSFDERTLIPLTKSRHNSPKPKLPETLEELESLRAQIGLWDKLYQEEEAKLGPHPTLEQKTRLYNLKHLIVELKKDQYVIAGEARAPLHLQSYHTPDPFEEDSFLIVLPLGLKVGPSLRFIDHLHDPDTTYKPPNKEELAARSFLLPLDFTNPTHIQCLLNNYLGLLEAATGHPDTNEAYLLDTLNFYLTRASLSKDRRYIAELKIRKVSNIEIQKLLEEKFGIHYNENYISTIFTKEICRRIAEAATSHYEEWMERNNEKAWKICSCCGERKLNVGRNFAKKKGKVDGLSNRCKDCDKKRRAQQKTLSRKG